MEIELKIEGKDASDSEHLFMNLSINGESGIGRVRLRWNDCGELLTRLGFYISTHSLDPDDCAELFTRLALCATRSDPQYEQEYDRLLKRFRKRSRKTKK